MFDETETAWKQKNREKSKKINKKIALLHGI